MVKMLICLLSHPTGTAPSRQLEDSIIEIGQQLDTVDQLRAQHAADLDSAAALQAIFVAPEYMFIAKSDAAKRLPLSEADRDRAEAALRDLSRKHPKVLMIPGTLFYEEAMTAEKIKQAKANVLAAEFSARMRRMAAGPKPVRFSPSALFDHDPSNDIGLEDARGHPHARASLHAPELEAMELGHRDETDSRGNVVAGGMQRPGLLNVLTGLKPDSVRARNRMLALLDGEVVAMYDKHSDFFEAGQAPDRYFFVPGTNESSPLIGGFRFSFEICFDHALGVSAARHVADIDFQVVMSDWVELQEEHVAVRLGGYAIHASSSRSACAVWRRTAAGYDKAALPPTPLLCFLVPLSEARKQRAP